VHRIGRTGRAGREGTAITLVEAREHRLLRNIEHHTKRKISIQQVPTAHDLRARRLDLTRAALEEALAEGELDKYRSVVESLAAEHDVLDLAAAAVKLADKARDGGAEDDADIPTTPASLPPAFLSPKGAGKKGAPRAAFVARGTSAEMTKLWIGLGRSQRIGPGDLVGAIANEARINSREIGAIDIADNFSLVEVSSALAANVVSAMRGKTIRGNKVSIRIDRKN
jgi:ATP-dependent RNA helicase DeaD